MGAQCTGCVSGKKLSSARPCDYSTSPEDITQYDPKLKPSLPKLKFSALLCNIKIVNYPKNSVSLKFNIERINESLFPKKNKVADSNQIKWKLKQKFEFILDQYQLRKKFLDITIQDQLSKKPQHLKINLYKIATGPYHHDFAILGSKSDTRLQFDFKISQEVEIKINCEQVSAQLTKKQYPGQSFYFTIRVLRQEKSEPFQSNSSYLQKNPYQQVGMIENVSSQYDQCPSPLRIRGRPPMKSFKNCAHFHWLIKNGQMPNFAISLKTHELKSTSLHFVIWKMQNQNQDDSIMFCGAYIPITKIFQYDPLINNNLNKNNKIQQRVISIQNEGIWSDEQKYGEYTMKFSVNNTSFIKQMKACTRTQLGIIESFPFFTTYGTLRKKQSRLLKYTTIQNSLLNIQNLNKEINQNTNLSCYHSQKLKTQMMQQFQKIKVFFENQLENSYVVSSNQQQSLKMMQDQSILLTLVQKIISYSQDDQIFLDVCWRIITVIMKRGQFNLNNVGFNKNQISQINRNINPQFYRKKIKNGLNYQQVLYKLFLKSLKIGYIEGGQQDPKQSIQMFRAYCYFRIPQYREVLLRKVVRKQDQKIQWKVNIADTDIDSMPQAQSVLSSQLDWQNYFYKPLGVQSKSISLNKQMLQNLQGSVWIQQVSKRGSTFFYFLYFLIARLSELGKKIKFIKWQYFPGYNKLIRGFLCEMKNLKIQQYPQSLKQTSINLLANDKLLNILVSIVFQKTNVNDCNSLMKGLDLISRYLNHFTKNKKLLPPTFNYVYFFKAIKIVLQGQFSYGITKLIGIIYANFDNFNVEFRKNLALYLLGKVFFKLFLNWSFTTRSAFYHFLLLKIQKSRYFYKIQCRQQFANKDDIMTQISKRYDQCLNIVRKALSVYNQDNMDRFLKSQKVLHKMLKRKLANRKRLKQGKSIKKPAINMNKIDQRQSFASDVSLLLPRNSLKDSSTFSKYAINELYKKNQMQRTHSVVLDPNMIKNLRHSIKGTSNKQKQNQQQQQFNTRTRSGTTYVENNQIQSSWDHNPGKSPKKLRQRRHSICGAQDSEIRQMEKRQVQYLPVAVKEFDNLDSAIKKYYMENGEFPICALEIEVPIDENQIKPQSVNFQDWSASEGKGQ